MPAAVIYCRCSTEEESQVDALRKQVIEAENCVRENGWFLADRYVESKSGTTSKGREEYCRLFDDMSGEKFDIIVIKSQDRLMRNTKDWYIFLDRMLSQGKKLYLYLERKFYSTDDALITGIKAILAEEYSRELSKKIVNAHKHRQKNGGKVMLTNKAYGFQKQPDGSVSIVEEEADVIRRIFQYCASGYGSRAIANMLQQEQVLSRNEKYMTAATIRRMIRNPLYKGIFVMNRQHFDFETKKVIQNEPGQWIFRKGLVPAIVDEELWERANEAMSKRAVQNHRDGSYAKGSNPGKYLLSGKLICGMCGRPYYRVWRRSYAEPEKIIYEWKCGTYVEQGRSKRNRRNGVRKDGTDTKGGCDSIHLEEEIVVGLLEQLAVKYYHIQQQEKDGIIQKAVQLLEQTLQNNDSGMSMARLEEQENAMHKRKDLLLEKLLDGIISDEDYREKSSSIEKKVDELHQKREALSRQIHEQEQIAYRLREIRKRLENGGFEKAAVGQMLRNISCIVVHEWQLEVRFDSMQIMGLSSRQGLLQNPGTQFSEFVEYPFPPDTEKGRMMDRVRILECLEENGNQTAGDLAAKLGRTKGIIWSRIRELKKQGCLHFEGSGGHGYWKVLKILPRHGEQERG